MPHRPRHEGAARRRRWLALALALLPALPAGGQDESALASGGALRIVADPPRLTLGVDAGAELRIAAPPEVEELVLTASAGRIEGVKRLPGGGFTARYRPPVERWPQVAIVAALGRGPKVPLDGWLAVPLSGQGEAKVRGEPGEDVTLRIGDVTFGPGRVGPDGVARLQVVVPPGVREGHHGFTPVDLAVPETPLVHAVVERPTVLADRREQVRFLAYVVAPHGAARRADPPVVEPSRGTAALTDREPGAFEGVWTLPAGAAGEERLTVRLPGLPASKVTLRVQAVPGPPATLAVAFDRSSAAAGTGEVTVTARALDAAGNAAAGPLELAVDAGALEGVREEPPGVVTARVRAPERLGGRSALTVTARAPSSGVSGARALAVEAGPAATAVLSPTGQVVAADGAREVRLAFAAVDRFENPVAVRPEVAVAHGQVTGIEPDGAGGWHIAYRPAAVAARTQERVVAQVGSAHGEADLLLVPPMRGLALFAAGGPAAALGSHDAGFRFSAAAEAALPGARMPWPDAYAGALRFELDGLALSGGGERRRVLAILAGADLRRELFHGPELWGGATAGLVWARAGAASGGFAPAARLFVGAGWPGRRVTPYLEAGLLAAGGTPGRAAGLVAVQVSAGVRLDLGAWTWRPSSSSTTSP